MTELMHLLTDPAHWAFEFIADSVFALLGAPVGAWWVRRHDRKHHPKLVALNPKFDINFLKES